MPLNQTTGFPSASKLIDKKWEERRMRLHAQKIHDVQPKIKTAPPKVYPHMILRLKKIQGEEQRQAEIDKDNQVLLQRMTWILKRKGQVDNWNDYRRMSMNKLVREREQQEIAEKNLSIARKLESVKPYYNVSDWEEDYEKRQHLQGQWKNSTKDFEIATPRDSMTSRRANSMEDKKSRGSNGPSSKKSESTPSSFTKLPKLINNGNTKYPREYISPRKRNRKDSSRLSDSEDSLSSSNNSSRNISDSEDSDPEARRMERRRQRLEQQRKIKETEKLVQKQKNQDLKQKQKEKLDEKKNQKEEEERKRRKRELEKWKEKKKEEEEAAIAKEAARLKKLKEDRAKQQKQSKDNQKAEEAKQTDKSRSNKSKPKSEPIRDNLPGEKSENPDKQPEELEKTESDEKEANEADDKDNKEEDKPNKDDIDGDDGVKPEKEYEKEIYDTRRIQSVKKDRRVRSSREDEPRKFSGVMTTEADDGQNHLQEPTKREATLSVAAASDYESDFEEEDGDNGKEDKEEEDEAEKDEELEELMDEDSLADNDARLLFRAVKNLSKPEEIVVKTLIRRSPKQRMLTKEKFEDLYEMNLGTELKKVLGSPHFTLVDCLLGLKNKKDTTDINQALKTGDIRKLVDILTSKGSSSLASTTTSYKRAMAQDNIDLQYFLDYDVSLEQDIRDKISDEDCQNLLLALLTDRPDNDRVDEDLAASEAEQLSEAGEGRFSNENGKFILLVQERSPLQLTATLAAYKQMSGGSDITELLEEDGCSENFITAVKALDKSSSPGAAQLAEQIHGQLKPNNAELINCLLDRSDQEMMSVRKSYRKRYAGELTDDIIAKCGKEAGPLIAHVAARGGVTPAPGAKQPRPPPGDKPKRVNGIRVPSPPRKPPLRGYEPRAPDFGKDNPFYEPQKRTIGEHIRQEAKDKLERKAQHKGNRTDRDGKKFKTPSKTPRKSYNPDEDVKRIKQAMKGFGTDEDPLIEIMAGRTNEQRQQIRKKYQEKYKSDLLEDLKSELSGDLEEAVLALMMSPAEYDAYCLHDAVTGPGTNEAVLIGILSTRNAKELKAISSNYEAKYEESLADVVESESSGSFGELLGRLVRAERDQGGSVDQKLVNQDAEDLYQDGDTVIRTDNETFKDVMTKRNRPHARAVFDKYKKLSGRSINDVIKNSFAGDTEEGYVGLAQALQSSSDFYANRLHSAMSGVGTNDKALIRILVSRSEVDLADIKSRYKDLHKKTLDDAVDSECSGDYKKLLLAIIKDKTPKGIKSTPPHRGRAQGRVRRESRDKKLSPMVAKPPSSSIIKKADSRRSSMSKKDRHTVKKTSKPVPKPKSQQRKPAEDSEEKEVDNIEEVDREQEDVEIKEDGTVELQQRNSDNNEQKEKDEEPEVEVVLVPRPPTPTKGTISPAPDVNVDNDLAAMEKALLGLNIDEDAIIALLPKRTVKQRMSLRNKYKEKHSKDLIPVIRSKLRGDFKETVVQLLMSNEEIIAKGLQESLESITEDNCLLNGLLGSCTRKEIDAANSIYYKENSKAFLDDIADCGAQASYVSIVEDILCGSRDQSYSVDEDGAMQDAKILYNDGTYALKLRDDTFKSLLTKANCSQAKAVCNEFHKLADEDIEEGIKWSMIGDSEDAVLGLLKCLRDPVTYFVDHIHEAMEGLGTDDSKLISIIISRSEIDLQSIKEKFFDQYSKDLAWRIRSECSGDYKKILLALLNEDYNTEYNDGIGITTSAVETAESANIHDKQIVSKVSNMTDSGSSKQELSQTTRGTSDDSLSKVEAPDIKSTKTMENEKNKPTPTKVKKNKGVPTKEGKKATVKNDKNTASPMSTTKNVTTEAKEGNENGTESKIKRDKKTPVKKDNGTAITTKNDKGAQVSEKKIKQQMRKVSTEKIVNASEKNDKKTLPKRQSILEQEIDSINEEVIGMCKTQDDLLDAIMTESTSDVNGQEGPRTEDNQSKSDVSMGANGTVDASKDNKTQNMAENNKTTHEQRDDENSALEMKNDLIQTVLNDPESGDKETEKAMLHTNPSETNQSENLADQATEKVQNLAQMSLKEPDPTVKDMTQSELETSPIDDTERESTSNHDSSERQQPDLIDLLLSGPVPNEKNIQKSEVQREHDASETNGREADAADVQENLLELILGGQKAEDQEGTKPNNIQDDLMQLILNEPTPEDPSPSEKDTGNRSSADVADAQSDATVKVTSQEKRQISDFSTLGEDLLGLILDGRSPTPTTPKVIEKDLFQLILDEENPPDKQKITNFQSNEDTGNEGEGDESASNDNDGEKSLAGNSPEESKTAGPGIINLSEAIGNSIMSSVKTITNGDKGIKEDTESKEGSANRGEINQEINENSTKISVQQEGFVEEERSVDNKEKAEGVSALSSRVDGASNLSRSLEGASTASYRAEGASASSDIENTKSSKMSLTDANRPRDPMCSDKQEKMEKSKNNVRQDTTDMNPEILQKLKEEMKQYEAQASGILEEDAISSDKLAVKDEDLDAGNLNCNEKVKVEPDEHAIGKDTCTSTDDEVADDELYGDDWDPELAAVADKHLEHRDTITMMSTVEYEMLAETINQDKSAAAAAALNPVSLKPDVNSIGGDSGYANGMEDSENSNNGKLNVGDMHNSALDPMLIKGVVSTIIENSVNEYTSHRYDTEEVGNA